jgi:RNA polymerase sigma factor (sigma-70 family)
MGASADDLASAAGLALVEAMIRYDPERSAASGRRVSFSTVIGWAILAVINKMMDDAIVRTSRKTVALGEHEYDVADTRHAVEAGTSSVLERLLARMTSQEREIVTMRYGIGRASMSYAEIAATKHFSKQRAEQIARSAIERVSARDRIASSTAHDCALLWLSLGPMTVDQMYEKIGSRMSEQVVEYMREAGEISPVPGPGIKTAWSLTEKGRSSANVVRQRNLL